MTIVDEGSCDKIHLPVIRQAGDNVVPPLATPLMRHQNRERITAAKGLVVLTVDANPVAWMRKKSFEIITVCCTGMNTTVDCIPWAF